jgi:hypothetical protein
MILWLKESNFYLKHYDLNRDVYFNGEKGLYYYDLFNFWYLLIVVF